MLLFSITQLKALVLTTGVRLGVQLVWEISKACTSNERMVTHTRRVALLAALATYDQNALSKVEDLVDFEHGRSVRLTEMGVRLLNEVYRNRMGVAADQDVQDGAAMLGHICYELVHVMWYNCYMSAKRWLGKDVGVAATLVSLVDVVVKAIPHSWNRDEDMQRIFQVRWCRSTSDMHAWLATCGHIPHSHRIVHIVSPQAYQGCLSHCLCRGVTYTHKGHELLVGVKTTRT